MLALGAAGAPAQTGPAQTEPAQTEPAPTETAAEDVTLALALSGAGEVEVEPVGLVCAESCSPALPAGTEVTLVAAPASGLVIWGGACEGATGESCTLTLDADASVSATFLAASPPPPSTAPPPTETTPPPTVTAPPVTTTGEPPPAPGATPGQKAIDAAVDGLPVGRIAFNTPTALGLGETATIHLVLSLRETHAQLRERITELGETAVDEVRVSDDMEARLSGAAFEIVPLGDERKPVSARDTTEWFWHVTPTETGVLELRVTLSAFVRVAGEEKKREIRVFSKRLEIRVGWTDRLGDFLGGNWQWLWTAILVPLSAWAVAHRRSRSSRAPHPS